MQMFDLKCMSFPELEITRNGIGKEMDSNVTEVAVLGRKQTFHYMHILIRPRETSELSNLNP